MTTGNPIIQKAQLVATGVVALNDPRFTKLFCAILQALAEYGIELAKEGKANMPGLN